MSTDRPIRLLLIGGAPEDTELAAWATQEEGLRLEWKRVETEAEFVATLDGFDPDVVVSGYSMPQFEGMRALSLSLARDSELPFIVLTGSLDEETAVACLKAGATDYVVEDRMARLPFAVKEALEKRRTLGRFKAEKALQESEAKFSRAFQSSPACLIITAIPGGRIVDVNETWCRALGYQRDRLVGRTTVEIGLWAEPDERERAHALFNAETRIRDGEVIFVTSGGERRTFLSSSELIEVGGEQCVLSTAVDITNRKRDERAVVDALETNRALIENCPLGVMSFKASGTCIAANEAAARIVGATVDELMLQDFRRLESWKESGVYDLACEALSTGRSVSAEIEMSTSFGKHVLLAEIITPFEIGGEPHLMVMFDDVTERRRAEAAERESEERFRAVVDGAPDGIFVHVGETIDFANPAMARLVGAASPDDLVGTEFLSWIAPEYHESVRARIRAVSEGRVPGVAMEREYVRLDGSRVAVETIAVLCPFRGQDANMVFVRDRTERREAEENRAVLEEQLQQAQKMESVGLLAGGVAHDFNNLLMVQKGYCELMRSDPQLDSRALDGVTQIELCVDRATALTRQLLAFGRKQTLHPVVLDLNLLVDDMSDMLQSLVGEGVDLVMLLGPEPALVKADPVQVEQVLVNLAANARDAMPHGGRLELEVAEVEMDEAGASRHLGMAAGTFIVLAVSDNGCGMDAETIRHIFEPFYTTKGEGKGTGLGLSTVYGIVQQSGGSIYVESEVGGGTTFRVYLPRAENEPRPDAKPVGGMVSGQGELILVVEDEPVLRDLARLMVENLGYRAVVAGSAAEATLLVEEQGVRPDLVLTDVVMPGADGAALVEYLRHKAPRLKVVFMSGYADTAIQRPRVIDSDVTFLQKPFSMADLSDKLKSALSSQEATSIEREV